MMRILALAALCALTIAYEWIEKPSPHFADREDAMDAGIFAKGWLPEWLPASVKHLGGKHGIVALIVGVADAYRVESLNDAIRVAAKPAKRASAANVSA